jgi:hypothetical protein
VLLVPGLWLHSSILKALSQFRFSLCLFILFTVCLRDVYC